MAGQHSLRDLIDLIEGKNRAPQQQEPWKIVASDIFAESVAKTRRIFRDIDEKIVKFSEVKLANPIANKYGKHDGPMTPGTPLAGFLHCHLRDDAILIYRLGNRQIFLVCIVSHADIEGKRGNKLGKSLRQYLKDDAEPASTEKFWVNTATGEIEMVFDHEEYGSIRDAIIDGYVQGSYSNPTNTFHLVATSSRTLSLALRAILTNHNSTRGCSYELLSGEKGDLDYVGMMSVRNTGAIPLEIA